METTPPPLVITAGEPAGIGPDLVIQLAQHPCPQPLVVIADPELLAERAHRLRLPLEIEAYHADRPVAPAAHTLTVEPLSLDTPCTPGHVDPANAAYVLESLHMAIRGCLEGRFAALVTAPLHKGVINDAGIPFTGHTEFLAAATATEHVVMMLATPRLRVALATTHLPLRKVADAITPTRLSKVIHTLDHDLRQRFAIPDPQILVCGLNPHAGEQGYLGREEIEIIEPTLKRLRSQGLRLNGPLPADTLFTPRNLDQADAVLAMYHDQGLPVLKHTGFGQAVNITLGLPIIRTSVDHGTALTLAGSGHAETESLIHAIKVAAQMHLASAAPSLGG